MEKKFSYMICSSIIIGSLILGLFVYLGFLNFQSSQSEASRYEIVDHGISIIVFDKETGDYWTKYMSTTEAPSDWVKAEIPTE